MNIVYRPPQSEKEFTDYFYFRWEQLRKPLGLERGSEQDRHEKTAFHIAAFNGNEIIAVARLQLHEDSTARIRYMAVDEEFRKRGIGSNLLSELEGIARTQKIHTCWLLARENAVHFYEKNNYEIKGAAESDLAIAHQKMEKTF